jgi:hypothetical protein
LFRKKSVSAIPLNPHSSLRTVFIRLLLSPVHLSPRKERMLNKDESGMENSYETAKIG